MAELRQNGMEAIILAGGFGSRLQSIVKDVPKPMADIQGRPFLSYVLDFLSREGVRRILLSVGYMHDVIERYFGLRYGNADIEYVREQYPLGTGGAIREALKHAAQDDVFVLNGDTFFPVDLRAMLGFHRSKKAGLTIALKPSDSAERYGAVVLGPDSRITGFQEKGGPERGCINGGVYIVNRGIAGMLQEQRGSFSFEREFLQQQLRRIAAFGFVSDAFFIDIGIPLDYKKARESLPRAVKERLA